MDRVVDWTLGLSVLGWAVTAVVRGHGSSPVGITIIVINVVVGWLFLRRRSAARLASPVECAICLGSVASSAIGISLAPAPVDWPLGAALLFTVAGAGAVVSLLTLGGSFGVLPALRRLVRRGPYGRVRHPIYLAELIMVLACALAGWRPLSVVAVVLAVLLVVVRIRIEERLLAALPGYASYGHRVRWRLLPGLW